MISRRDERLDIVDDHVHTSRRLAFIFRVLFVAFMQLFRGSAASRPIKNTGVGQNT